MSVNENGRLDEDDTDLRTGLPSMDVVPLVTSCNEPQTQTGATLMKRTLKFTLEKETKGAVRYAEDKENALAEGVIGTLYVRKAALATMGHATAPTSLVVTLETSDG